MPDFSFRGTLMPDSRSFRFVERPQKPELRLRSGPGIEKRRFGVLPACERLVPVRKIGSAQGGHREDKSRVSSRRTGVHVAENAFPFSRDVVSGCDCNSKSRREASRHDFRVDIVAGRCRSGQAVRDSCAKTVRIGGPPNVGMWKGMPAFLSGRQAGRRMAFPLFRFRCFCGARGTGLRFFCVPLPNPGLRSFPHPDKAVGVMRTDTRPSVSPCFRRCPKAVADRADRLPVVLSRPGIAKNV